MGRIQNTAMHPSLSKEVLSRFVGKRIARLVRYSWWRKEDVASECNVSPAQSFSFTAGPLAIVFEDGVTLGIASDPAINSVVIWVDKESEQVDLTDTLTEDPELFPIDASDASYADSFWNEFPHRTIVGFSILKSNEMSAGEAQLPSELGLSIHFDNNENFIATHGLHDGSDDFSVLRCDQLDERFKGKLNVMPFL